MHGIPGAESYLHQLIESINNAVVTTLLPMFAGGLVGIVSGGILVGLMTVFNTFKKQKTHA
jgi:predicted DNA repair protein MutK